MALNRPTISRMTASTRSSPMPQRRSGGSWKPGQSGNPRGRPPVQFDISAMCREHAPEAVAALVLALGSAKERVPAAIALLDRGFGKPTQTIETNDPNSPIVLHLLAAKLVSEEIMDRMKQREQQQPTTTIDGHAEPSNGQANGAFDFLNAPLPTE